MTESLAHWQNEWLTGCTVEWMDGWTTSLWPTVSVNKLPNYLTSPQSRAICQKLTVPQLVTKFPAFYGTQNFITIFKSAHNYSLPWAI